MKIFSPAFLHNEKIPSKYTCDGENINPPLEFQDIPVGSKSLALIVEDPDVSKHLREDGLWIHWILWNISPDVQKIEEGSGAPINSREGITTYGKPGYGGPCPPDREHRYFFKLYALDIMLKLPTSASRNDLLSEMEGHILEIAELLGRYERM